MALPLQGVRVLDLATIVAGPFGTTMLADMGADVIKIEAPVGDDCRHMGPRVGVDSGTYVGVNRNKRGSARSVLTGCPLSCTPHLGLYGWRHLRSASILRKCWPSWDTLRQRSRTCTPLARLRHVCRKPSVSRTNQQRVDTTIGRLDECVAVSMKLSWAVTMPKKVS